MCLHTQAKSYDYHIYTLTLLTIFNWKFSHKCQKHHMFLNLSFWSNSLQKNQEIGGIWYSGLNRHMLTLCTRTNYKWLSRPFKRVRVTRFLTHFYQESNHSWPLINMLSIFAYGIDFKEISTCAKTVRCPWYRGVKLRGVNDSTESNMLKSWF